MKTNLSNLNFPFIIILLMLSSLIPWPGPTIFKISCPKENTRIVRNIVQSKWIPVLEKYKVKLPLECPFHPQRDIFEPQQTAKKQHRPSQWTCDICGKSFFEEKYLDLHFDNRHKEYINMAEDAVCLADYCDIMRCDVMNNLDWKSITTNHINTDIELWRDVSSSYSSSSKSLINNNINKESASSSSSSSSSISHDSTPMNTGNLIISEKKYKKTTTSTNQKRCQKTDAPSINNNDDDDDSDLNLKDSNTSSSSSSSDSQHQNSSINNDICQNDLVDSALPGLDNRQQRLNEIQQLKANCKPEELQKLKTKCEILIRDCIASLLIPLSVKDFKEIEDELNRAVCWYLTCDRYWEDSQNDLKSFPWGLISMIIMVLSLGICLCYYIVWVLFDTTDDISVTTSASVTDRSTPSPAHLLRSDIGCLTDGHHVYSEEYVNSTVKDNDYIYVTYPTELKRRLMDSCYNRTTRL